MLGKGLGEQGGGGAGGAWRGGEISADIGVGALATGRCLVRGRGVFGRDTIGTSSSESDEDSGDEDSSDEESSDESNKKGGGIKDMKINDLNRLKRILRGGNDTIESNDRLVITGGSDNTFGSFRGYGYTFFND